jgi:hypothetical protein
MALHGVVTNASTNIAAVTNEGDYRIIYNSVRELLIRLFPDVMVAGWPKLCLTAGIRIERTFECGHSLDSGSGSNTGNHHDGRRAKQKPQVN